MRLIDALQPDSPYVFYSDDHGFCINTADVMDILTMDKESVIYRQDAIDEIKEIYEWHDNVTKERIIEHFERLPFAQPATDCVSRQAAIDAVSKWFYDVFGIKESDGTATIFKRLRELPSAQPERKGKWIKLDMHAHLADHKCTACGQECYVPTCMGEPMYTYCPNCGARMEGESDEID